MQHQRRLAFHAVLRIRHTGQRGIDRRFLEWQPDRIITTRRARPALWADGQALPRRRAQRARATQDLHWAHAGGQIALGPIQVLDVLDRAVVYVRVVDRPWTQLVGRDAGTRGFGRALYRILHCRIDGVEDASARELGQEAVDFAAHLLRRTRASQTRILASHDVNQRAFTHDEHDVLQRILGAAALGDLHFDVEEVVFSVKFDDFLGQGRGRQIARVLDVEHIFA